MVLTKKPAHLWMAGSWYIEVLRFKSTSQLNEWGLACLRAFMSSSH